MFSLKEVEGGPLPEVEGCPLPEEEGGPLPEVEGGLLPVPNFCEIFATSVFQID